MSSPSTHRQLLDVDAVLDKREKQLAALKSAETLLADTVQRVNGAGLLLGLVGISKDAPVAAELAAVRMHLREAWTLVSKLAATAEEHGR